LKETNKIMNFITELFEIVGKLAGALVALALAGMIMALPSLFAGSALYLFWNYFLENFVVLTLNKVAFMDCWAVAFLLGIAVRSLTYKQEEVKAPKEEK